MIFLKYDKIYSFKLEITEPFVAKFSDVADKRNSYKFLFDILFFFCLQSIQKSLYFLKTKSVLVQGILSAFHRKS